MNKKLEHDPVAYRRIIIRGYQVLSKFDPESLKALIDRLNQFSQKHPQHAFDIAPLEVAATEVHSILTISVRKENADSPNWKDKVKLENGYFSMDIDTFFEKVVLAGHQNLFLQKQSGDRYV